MVEVYCLSIDTSESCTLTQLNEIMRKLAVLLLHHPVTRLSVIFWNIFFFIRCKLCMMMATWLYMQPVYFQLVWGFENGSAYHQSVCLYLTFDGGDSAFVTGRYLISKLVWGRNIVNRLDVDEEKRRKIGWWWTETRELRKRSAKKKWERIEMKKKRIHYLQHLYRSVVH